MDDKGIMKIPFCCVDYGPRQCTFVVEHISTDTAFRLQYSWIWKIIFVESTSTLDKHVRSCIRNRHGRIVFCFTQFCLHTFKSFLHSRLKRQIIFITEQHHAAISFNTHHRLFLIRTCQQYFGILYRRLIREIHWGIIAYKRFCIAGWISCHIDNHRK